MVWQGRRECAECDQAWDKPALRLGIRTLGSSFGEAIVMFHPGCRVNIRGVHLVRDEGGDHSGTSSRIPSLIGNNASSHFKFSDFESQVSGPPQGNLSFPSTSVGLTNLPDMEAWLCPGWGRGGRMCVARHPSCKCQVSDQGSHY